MYYDLWNTKFHQKFPLVVKVFILVLELMLKNNVKIYINVNKQSPTATAISTVWFSMCFDMGKKQENSTSYVHSSP